MPNTNRPLEIQCPKCPHIGCTLMVRSITVITVTCASCRHTWSTRLDFLPENVQRKIHAILFES